MKNRGREKGTKFAPLFSLFAQYSLVLSLCCVGLSETPDVSHKPVCAIAEEDYKLEISNITRRGIVLYPSSGNKGAGQLCSDMRHCFCKCQNPVFS